MNIYVSIENNKVKSYQIGMPSDNEKILIPSQYSLNDLQFLSITEKIEIISRVRLNENMETIVDDQGLPVLFDEEVLTYQFELDEEAKQDYLDSQTTQTIQKFRNDKLSRLRDLREPLLKEVDIMINELVLELRSDRQSIIDYRQSLMEFTDPYRYVNDPNRAKAAIDSLDLENINWPTKP